MTLAALALGTVACVDININDDGDSTRLDGSGDLVSEDFSLDGFDALKIAETFDATVRASDAFSVTVTTDDNVIQSVEIRVSDGTLHLGLESGLSLNRVTLRAEITMPELTVVELSGASHADLDGFAPQPAIDLSASGASSFEADLDTERLTLDLNGASSATLRGFAADARLEGSGASSLALGDLRIEDADVELSGASSAELTVLNHLDADLSGASNLNYDGDPQLGDISASSGASITRR